MLVIVGITYQIKSCQIETHKIMENPEFLKSKYEQELALFNLQLHLVHHRGPNVAAACSSMY